jgi:hypothetical protein
MSAKNYLAWFLSVVATALVALVAFNAYGERVILTDPSGASVETVSGFERVLKPAWLDSIAPQMVFVGSSRIREGFDPVLIDPAFGIKSFNYGVSSITPYEARRFLEDTLAHPSVKMVVLALDAFAGGNEAQKIGPGFDELRLAVTADGKPTPRRALWLFTTRYLSGGAAGMHALALYDLLQLKSGQTAADRPDLFEAYGRMSEASLRRDLAFRGERVMRLGRSAHEELKAALADLCPRPDVRAVLFFPPDNYAVIARYLANDRAGFLAFKQMVRDDVTRHNAACPNQIALFDFMTRNAITEAPMTNGVSETYLDLVHFRPPVGVILLKRMLGVGEAGLGSELVAPASLH